MDFLLSVANFLVNEVLSVPAFLIGIITAVGLSAMNKGAGQVMGGAIKATLDFLFIRVGAGLVTAFLEPLGAMITGATGAQGVVPTNEAIMGIAQEQFGGSVAWIMILGFAVSLALERVTPMKYVFLTWHHVLFISTLLTMVLATAGYLLLGGGALRRDPAGRADGLPARHRTPPDAPNHRRRFHCYRALRHRRVRGRRRGGVPRGRQGNRAVPLYRGS
ncbi:Ascorbate-specific permease IIC component UlaA [Corynebacterium lowii]|uniref:Ascorbate-specific PTS system EIIC component n=1 Tax=Corynebacterium lowii TaxID=1544413 RepID=A0A0Q0Z2I8_9CORY|nr:Ascorbate-specific permease IIC component UlaA [Corynebacterium lowii]MDP9850712.1 hypothetical protein [Corynebacterium lowii]